MYHIVIPVDNDAERGERSTRQVIELIENGPVTDSSSVSVTILNVFEEFRAVDDGGDVKSRDLYDEDSYPESVDRARQLLDESDIAYDLERRHGDASEEIVDFVESVGADLVVMAPRKRSAVGKVMFGSVAQHVILNTDRPTLIV